MAVKFGWCDFWAVYKSCPEVLQDEIDRLPEWLQQKSTRVQMEVLQEAPKEVVESMLSVLTIDCQIMLIQ